MHGNTSWNISQLCQYIKAERSVESSRRILLQGFIKENLLLLFFVLRHWAWTGVAVPDVIGGGAPLGVWSYYRSIV